MRLLPALVLAVSAAVARGATPGGGDPAEREAAPTKGVEAPVFTMPELVIVGENQARIIAQKEQLVGTPMSGLHEAPLLEKEEGTVAALRRREPAPRAPAPEPGAGAALRVEGGAPSWFGGALWLGLKGRGSLLALDGAYQRLEGEPAGAGRAGTTDAGITLGAARLLEEGELRAREEAAPDWLKAVSVTGLPDEQVGAIGWRERRADLPWYGGGAERRVSRWHAAGETGRSLNGTGGRGRAAHVVLTGPGGRQRGTFAGGRSVLPVLGGRTWRVRARPGVAAETADGTGDRHWLGAVVEAAWIPGGRWRYLAGLTAEYAAGDKPRAGLLGPVAGIAWSVPEGPTVSASLRSGLAPVFMSEQAESSPYSAYAGPVPVGRELARVELKVNQQVWNGTEGTLGYRHLESRNALTWDEVPGTGLYVPATLSRLRIGEFSAEFDYREMDPVRLFAEGRWRFTSADGGDVANLALGEGRIGIEWTWRGVVVGGDVAVARGRPRSRLGPELEPYADVGLSASWVPRERITVYARAGNVTGETVERWGGYPDPRRLFAFGVLAGF